MKNRVIWGIAGGVVVGAVFGFFIEPVFHRSNHEAGSKQVRLGEGKYTNPLLECEVAAGTIDAEKQNFEPEMQSFVSGIERRNGVDSVAVYFRDLNNGPAFGIQSNEPFVPASLLKVPVMMSYLKYADSNPGILKEKITFTESLKTNDINQLIPPEEHLKVGQSYTVDELIEKMIIYSDNESLLLLSSKLPLENQIYLYQLLGVDPSVISNPSASLTVRQYSAFFRIMFNASWLSQEMSEKALTLLANTKFKEGLSKGIPAEIPLAHKFGERLLQDGKQHMHDCGIVYYPGHPYLLCVMTRGSDIPVLEQSIGDVSAFVYSKIKAQYPY
jgi:beta-lactamase class A